MAFLGVKYVPLSLVDIFLEREWIFNPGRSCRSTFKLLLSVISMKTCCNSLFFFLLQINNTNLVPMCVLSVTGIMSVYVVIVTAKHSLNVETLDAVGYFDLKMAPLLTMRKIVNTRITSNAFLVNDVHIPYNENRYYIMVIFSNFDWLLVMIDWMTRV